ncbi:unnamed protein product [Soboliphyme baturini]|uniref:WD_REPEATS_REGION domain-containing protein n=1 Tax=Soboliphyme baturini TaxID=241478 RepID=A0A183IAY0_9BILA|nr:unnamed protein product [Soboliphyme baturini]
MSSPSDRKAELERKKAKLAAMREEKKRKEERRRQLLSTEAGKESLIEDADKILKELGISLGHSASSEAITPTNESSSVASLSADAPLNAAAASTVKNLEIRPMVQLQKTDTLHINVPPKESVVYAKSTQTEIDTIEKDLTHLHSYEWDDEFSGGVHQPQSTTGTSPEEVFDAEASPTHIIAGLLPHIEMVKPAEVLTDEAAHTDSKTHVSEAPELSEEEKRSIMSSEEFRHFFDRSATIIERALNEEADIFKDYSKDIDKEKADYSVKMSVNRCFFDENYSKKRCITCLDFSPQYPELLAVSYDNNEDAPHEPDGIVLVWNTKFKRSTPEFYFHSQSRVMSVAWAKFHPNLLIGGTYSGRICLWDNRNNKRTPVQKSSLSANAHTHPVYCLDVVGTSNAHNLVSISTDGKLCSWNLDMLSEPQESFMLQMKQSRPVSAMCLCFPLNDVNNFFVGGEDGCMYAGCRHGSKAGITEIYEGHFGPVMGIDCHAATGGSVDFSNIVLTCSADWTVKLWNTRDQKPLYSFEDHNDYVYDVAWCPIHPAIFTCADGLGHLDLWNLNLDTELPISSMTTNDGSSFNKVLWSKSGQLLAAGNDCGHIFVYEVNEQVVNPRSIEWSEFSKTLHEFKQNQVESDEFSQAVAAIR